MSSNVIYLDFLFAFFFFFNPWGVSMQICDILGHMFDLDEKPILIKSVVSFL